MLIPRSFMDPYAQQMGMQQGMVNPFRQSMMVPQITGYPAQPFAGNAWAQQPNGRMVAQSTGFAPQGFMPQQTGMPQGSPFMQPQSTGFLQPNVAQQSNAFAQPMMPQSTGPNPFRQSMVPQSTGSPFPTSPFPNTTQNSMQPPSGGNQVNIAKPLSVQPTGSKNPFALPSDHERKPSPQPTGPSLFQLSQMKSSTMPTGGNNFDSVFGNSGNPGGGFTNEFGALTLDSGKTQHSSTVSGKTGAMSDLASAFATGQDAKPQTSPFGNGMNAFGTGFSSSGLSSQTTGITSPPATGAFGGSSNPMQPQPTGFAGSSIKPFKPSSNFGSSLVDGLPPLPASGTGTPVGNASSNTPFNATPSNNAFGGATSPLVGQTTGFNPFSTQSTQNQGTGNAAFMNAFGTVQTTTNGGNAFGQGQGQTTATNGSGAFTNAFGTGNNSWMTAGR